MQQFLFRRGVGEIFSDRQSSEQMSVQDVVPVRDRSSTLPLAVLSILATPLERGVLDLKPVKSESSHKNPPDDGKEARPINRPCHIVT